MKQLLFSCALAATVFACTPKAQPAATSTSTGSTSSTSSTTTTTTTSTTTTAGSAVAAGHQVYNAKCGRCHNLKDPAHYTAERWVPILKSMAPKARLSEDETAQVAAYVNANAKK
ncbi:MAG: hypothetical protein EOO11_02950 [Chitinophagaceae bacterium]|nr:MAG: hypothetical protein EOO11_02950 [Chitinophagaceae bacterium]